LIVLLVVVGLCLYLIETYIPLDPVIKTVIRVVVVLCVVLYLLSAFGVVDVPVPRLKS
jgi:hypothetical protein